MLRPVGASLRAGLLMGVTGSMAWLTGEPFLFPSLGPSAYVLATAPTAETSAPRRVVGGHLVGIVAGLLAYWTIAPGLVATTPPPPVSTAGVRLAASAIVAVGLTTGGMLVTDLRHAPACATTLIVSLGLLATPRAGGIMLGAIGLLVGAHWSGRRLSLGRAIESTR